MIKRWTLYLIILITISAFAGCSNNNDPLEVFQHYCKAWEDMNYKNIYEIVSAENQQELTEENFVKAYELFYEGIQAEEIRIDLSNDEIVEEGDTAKIPFTVQVKIPEGTLTFSSSMEATRSAEGTWAILWDFPLIWEDLAAGDNITRSWSKPTRGEIYDRNGSSLAHNGFVVQIGMVPGRLGNMRNEMISALADNFNLSEQYIQDRLALPWVGEDTFVDMIKVPMERLGDVRALYNRNPGVTYREIKERVYPYGASAAHLTGYMSYPTESELESLIPIGFTSDDKIGRTGLESYLNERLQGIPGLTIAIRSNDGKEKKILFEKETVHGENVTLNIDAPLQQKLYAQMAGESGMATVMDHQSGEILALVSAPAYDPNSFILGLSSSQYNQLENDENKPLLNRFANTYSPGSSFKPLTAAIGLDSGTVDLNDSINIQGTQWQPDDSWGNHFVTRVNEINGSIDMETAMIYSDNIYFANLALQIGDGTFQNMAENFGIGKSMALLYPIKTSQLANESTINNEVLLADTGYGQGEVLVNILTLPKAYSSFVNNGNVIEPVLIRDEGLAPTKVSAISSETADAVYKMLEKTISLPHATGYGAYISGKTLAGKTGTAEIPAPHDASIKEELGWFVVLDLDENTPYATAMMLENVKGKGGSGYTVSKVKAFIQSYTK